MKTVIIFSVTSDIGRALAWRYLADGYRVIGTYRTKRSLSLLPSHPNLSVFPCDVGKKRTITSFLSTMREMNERWDICISCVGELRPLSPFFSTDFSVWKQSVDVNSLAQLALVHGLYPLHRPGATIVFFAGGGVNNPVVNMSSYTIGKIMLMKMCEYLQAENPDLTFFIVGPGWTKTKIHDAVLTDPLISSKKKQETIRLLKTSEGTSMQDIYDCIEWLRTQGRDVAGGRNFSVVSDPWRGTDAKKLAQALRKDPGMYTLKRYKNDWKP